MTPALVATRREQIVLALQALVTSDPFFPAAALDAPEPSNWRKPVPGALTGIQDHCTVQDDPDPPEVTRDGGAANDWELQLKPSFVYAVAGADRAERRSFRDQAQAHFVALIRANRDLGLGDVQIYAEVASAERDDDIPVKSAPPVAMIRLTLGVQFIADSAAG